MSWLTVMAFAASVAGYTVQLLADTPYCKGLCDPGTHNSYSLSAVCNTKTFIEDLEITTCSNTPACALSTNVDVYIDGNGCVINEEPTGVKCTDATGNYPVNTYDTSCNPIPDANGNCKCDIITIPTGMTDHWVTCTTQACP